MPVEKKGYSNIIESTPNNNQINKDIFDGFMSEGSLKPLVGRVTDIVLNKDHDFFDKVGGYSGIGTIFFEIVGDPASPRDIASPITPQSSYYPLINELVILFSLPNTNIGTKINSRSYYYSSIISLWNNPHHNAFPNPLKEYSESTQENILNDYKKAGGGIVRRITDGKSDIDLNSKHNNTQVTFQEKTKTYPLEVFTGDLLNQGRFGNSIRLGSTNQYLKNGKVVGINDWSNNTSGGTTTGDPIIILRNGQNPDIKQPSWEPITENIDKDLSSIYLTSTQQIEIKPSSQRYFSYSSKESTPTTASKYKGKQVIINSGRLLFNANEDHLMLSSQKTISFESQKGFNFDTPSNFVIDVGTTIKLGGKKASESLILGDTFLKNLNHLITGIEYLCISLQGSTIWPAGIPIPDGVTATPAGELLARAKAFKANITNFKSTTSKTL